MQVTIEGTVKELAEHGLRVNGKPVTQQMLSVLVRIGACEEIGQVEKEPGAKGPAAKIYRFGAQKMFNFSIDNKPKKAQAEPEETANPSATTPEQAFAKAVQQEQVEGQKEPREVPAILKSLTEEELSSLATLLHKIMPNSAMH